MRNLRAAQEIAGILGGVSGEELLNLPPDEQILLMEGKLMRCKQVRYYTKDFDEFLAR
jgi:type IV secretory pathway TraG/TraD family ATPase VirD4